MPFDRSGSPEHVRREAHQAALAMLAAGLAGDVKGAEIIYDTTRHQPLIVALSAIAAAALQAAGVDPAAWVAEQQAGMLAAEASGG